jgi:hypothetical protein
MITLNYVKKKNSTSEILRKKALWGMTIEVPLSLFKKAFRPQLIDEFYNSNLNYTQKLTFQIHSLPVTLLQCGC